MRYVTVGISGSFDFLFKSYFIFYKKMENFDNFKIAHNFLTMFNSKVNGS